MNNIHFSLRKQGKSDPVIILQVFDSRFKGRKFMYSTSKVMDESLWLKKKGKGEGNPGTGKGITRT